MGQSAEELRHEIEDTRADLGETLDAIGDRVSPSRMVERRKNRVTSGLRDMRDRVMGSASDTSHSIGDTAGSAVDTLRATPDTVARQTQGNPLMAGAVAFGFGVLLASVIPASSKEKQVTEQLMDKTEPLKDELKRTGQEMAEHLKEPARAAMESVKETAAQGAQSVTETAKDAAETTKLAAGEGADDLRLQSDDDGDHPTP
jgi:hypothetical protein